MSMQSTINVQLSKTVKTTGKEKIKSIQVKGGKERSNNTIYEPDDGMCKRKVEREQWFWEFQNRDSMFLL